MTTYPMSLPITPGRVKYVQIAATPAASANFHVDRPNVITAPPSGTDFIGDCRRNLSATRPAVRKQDRHDDRRAHQPDEESYQADGPDRAQPPRRPPPASGRRKISITLNRCPDSRRT